MQLIINKGFDAFTYLTNNEDTVKMISRLKKEKLQELYIYMEHHIDI